MILLLALVVTLLTTQFVRRRRQAFVLREVPAYSTMPMHIGASIEANRPVHFSMGSASLGGDSTLLALASAEAFYWLGQRAVISPAAPILTVSDTTAAPLAYDILRRAYRSRGRLGQYRGGVRWYPAGPRSLAFAAALTATMGDDAVGANFLMGSFGPELALVADAAFRRDQALIAASDQLEGQAVAYVMSDQALIGEEIFVAGAYLGDEKTPVAAAGAQDVLRWILIASMLVTAALAVVRGG